MTLTLPLIRGAVGGRVCLPSREVRPVLLRATRAGSCVVEAGSCAHHQVGSKSEERARNRLSQFGNGCVFAGQGPEAEQVFDVNLTMWMLGTANSHGVFHRRVGPYRRVAGFVGVSHPIMG